MNSNNNQVIDVQEDSGFWSKIGKWFSEHPIAIIGAHAISLAFCIASIANIQTFIYMLDPNLAVSWGLGIALGFALWLMAIFLSSIEEWKTKQFIIVLTITLALALISGSIQASSYQSHVAVNPKVSAEQLDATMSLAWWIGYAMPLIGELGVALALSAYLEYRRRNISRVIQQSIMEANGQRMVRQILNMSDEVGKDQAIEQLERMTSEAYKLLTDQVISEMENGQPKRNVKKVKGDLPNRDLTATMKNGIKNIVDKVNHAHSSEDGDQTGAENGNSHQNTELANESEFGSHNLPAANAARLAEMENRQSAILKLLSIHGQLGAVAIQEMLKDDFGIVTTERTIRNDLEALTNSGKAEKIGRGAWMVPQQSIVTIAETAVSEFSTNGHSH